MRQRDRLRVRCLGLAPAVAVIALLVAAHAVSAGTWAGHGPDGGTITAVAVDPVSPSTVYAATKFSGVFKSTNAGITWAAAVTGLSNRRVNALAVDPSAPATVYAGTDGGVFKSTDAGATWAPMNTGLGVPNADSSLIVRALAINPSQTAVVYAGTLGFDVGGGVYKSTNGGTSWSLLLPNHNVSSLALQPGTPETVVAGSTPVAVIFGSGGVTRSTNGGMDWTELGDGFTPAQKDVGAVAFDTGNDLYVGSDDGIQRLGNVSGLWTVSTDPIVAGFRVTSLMVEPDRCCIMKGRIFAGTADGRVLHSQDITGWQAAAGVVGSDVRALALAAIAPDTVFAGTSAGLSRSTDAGLNWASSNTGLRATAITQVAVASPDGARVYAGSDGAGVFTSGDGGQSWNGLPVDAHVTVTDALATDAAGTLYASLHGPLELGVFKRTAGSGDWIQAGSGLEAYRVVAFGAVPAAPGVLFAGTTGDSVSTVFKTTTGGASWADSSNGLPPFAVSAFAVVDANTAYVATVFYGVYRTVNGGDDWTPTMNEPTTQHGRSIVVDPAVPTTLLVATENGVSRSLDAGDSWTLANNGLTTTDVRTLAMHPAGGVVYAGTAAGVFRSANAGASWNAVNAGLTTLSVLRLTTGPAGGRLYAGTEGGGAFAFAECGDAFLDPGEACDAGAANGSAASCCAADCTLRAPGDACTGGFCDGGGLCIPSTCGNGTVEVAEECDGGECCAADCRFRGSSEPCGGITPVCQEPRLCTGTQPDCPDVPTFKATGEPCFPEDAGCTIGACDGQGTCDPRGQVCAADAKPQRNGSRRLRIKVTCQSDKASECAAAANDTAGVAAVVTRGAAPGASEPITETGTTVTKRRRTKRGLKFKSVLRLKLNERGRQLLAERAVDAVVVVRIHRDGRDFDTRRAVRLLRFRK